MSLVSLDAQGAGGGPMNVRGCGKREPVVLFAESCQRAMALPLGINLMTRMVDGGGT